MTADREPLHQPPNPADLRRMPPAAPECAMVRGWLRDYADGDLGTQLGRRLEEHVHRCRACGLELARAEHELLAVRRAFAALAAELPLHERRVRTGFARRVVDRLVVDETTIGLNAGAVPPGAVPPGAVPPGAVPPGADADADSEAVARADVGAMGAGAGRAGSRGEGVDGSTGLLPGAQSGGALQNAAAGSPLGMLIASLLLLVGIGVGVRFLAGAAEAPNRIAQLIVMLADGTYDDSGRPFGLFNSLGELESLHVVRGGAARLSWIDAKEGRQPAARIDVEGGEVRLQDGAPLLVSGKVLVETNRDVDLPLADGSRIELGMGQYVISAEIPADLLADQSLEPGQDPLSFLPDDLRIQVETRYGDPARIVRQGAAVTIAAGKVGIYSGASGVIVQAAPVPRGAADPIDTRIAAVPNSPVQPQVYGLVQGPGGLPSIGAQVFLTFPSQGGRGAGVGQTTVDGSFQLPTPAPCDGSFAIVLARGAFAQDTLGIVAPLAVPVERQGPITRLTRPIELDTSRVLNGVVRDEMQQLRAGVRVLPCIVDELFGTVLPLPDFATTTDSLAAFHIERLPAGLSAHQSLVLLLQDVSIEPTVVPVPVRASALATQEYVSYTVRNLRVVSVEELPWTSQTLFEEVPGLPPGTAAVRRATYSSGSTQYFTVGHGALWLRLNNALVRRLERTNGPVNGSFERYHPVGAPVALSDQFWPLTGVEEGVGRVELHSAYRYERFVTAMAAVEALAVSIQDSHGQPVPEAQVFAVRTSGPRDAPESLFLGLTSVTGGLSLAGLPANASVVAIGPNGAIGLLSDLSGAGNVADLTVRDAGRVLVAASLRPANQANLSLRFAMVEGLGELRPVAMRTAGVASGWEVGGLAPGTYRVDVNNVTHTVVVPSGGFAILQ